MAMRKIIDSSEEEKDPSNNPSGDNSSENTKTRYGTLLVNGVTSKNRTTFRVVHKLGTRHPSRLITKAGGTEEEVHPFVQSLSSDEVEIIFSPQVEDSSHHATFWK